MDQPKSQILAMDCVRQNYLVEQDVFGLEVAVDDVAVVHELHGLADLLHHQPRLLLLEPPVLLQRGVHVPPAAQLHRQVEVLLVREEAVQLHDVGVVQETLDLYFANDLPDELVLALEDALGYFLEGADEVGEFVPASVMGYLTR